MHLKAAGAQLSRTGVGHTWKSNMDPVLIAAGNDSVCRCSRIHHSSFVSRAQQVVFDWASCLICSFPALKLFLWMPCYPSVTPALEWDTQNSSLSSFSVLSPPFWSSVWWDCTGWSWVLSDLTSVYYNESLHSSMGWGVVCHMPFKNNYCWWRCHFRWEQV